MAELARNPLSAADKRNLQQALYSLKQNVLNLETAESAGIDVTEARMVNEQRINAVTKMLNAYWPEG